MSSARRSAPELLEQALDHLQIAREYAARDLTDPVVIDAIAMRLSAATDGAPEPGWVRGRGARRYSPMKSASHSSTSRMHSESTTPATRWSLPRVMVRGCSVIAKVGSLSLRSPLRSTWFGQPRSVVVAGRMIARVSALWR